MLEDAPGMAAVLIAATDEPRRRPHFGQRGDNMGRRARFRRPRGAAGAALTDWLCDGFGRALADPERFEATSDSKGVLSFMARRRTS